MSNDQKIDELIDKVDFLSTENARTQVLWERVDSQYRVIAEGLEGLREVPARLDRLEADVSEIKTDVKIIKDVVRDHSVDIKELKAKSHSH